VLSHHAVLSSLDAYADGTLPDSERANFAAHLRSCAGCGASLRQLQRLDQVLNDLPPMQAIPFARFWSQLEPRLPSQAQKGAPLFRPGRLAAGFALAVCASLVGVVALASDGTMPDSFLYPVKHFRQSVQLDLTGSHERPHVELSLVRQRVQEAKVMLDRQKDSLAVASLRDASTLLVDAATQLKNTPQSDTHKVDSTIAQIQTELHTVSEANRQPDGSTPEETAAVDGAVKDAQNAVTQAQTEVDATAPGNAAPIDGAATSGP
jgi:uncharacterized protein DUF5667/putative zinc finger protein